MGAIFPNPCCQLLTTTFPLFFRTFPSGGHTFFMDSLLPPCKTNQAAVGQCAGSTTWHYANKSECAGPTGASVWGQIDYSDNHCTLGRGWLRLNAPEQLRFAAFVEGNTPA